MKLKQMLIKVKDWWVSYSGKRGMHPVLAILLSVLVAFVLWFYVQDAESPNYEKPIYNVPVRIEGLAEDLTVIEGGDFVATVELKGKRSDLNRLKASDLEAYLDLSSITEPVTHYEARVSALFPNGMELLQITPGFATVTVDRTISKEVPVEVEMGLYTVAEDVEIKATPAVTEISVYGPKTVVDTIETARISTGDLGNVTQGFTRTLEFTLLDKNGQTVSERHLTLPNKNVSVTFSLSQVKTVPLIVKTAHDYWEENSWRYTVSPETVRVEGDPNLIAHVEEIVALTIDETQFDATQMEQKIAPAELELPQGIALAETLGEVTVNTTVLDSAVRYIRVPLTSEHLTEDPPVTSDGTVLLYDYNTDAVTLKVRGPARAVKSASADDFILFVDLSSYTNPGTYEVDAEIIMNTGAYAVGSYRVGVTIRKPES